MKNTKLISVVMVAVLGLLQAPAMANPGKGNNGRHHGNDCGRNEDCGGHGDDQGDQGDHGHRGRGEQGSYRSDNERGAGPSHGYYRGDRLPVIYRTRQYVVEDWRGHGLRTPPRGYHWVQTGSDYVLVAIATGVILELLLNH